MKEEQIDREVRQTLDLLDDFPQVKCKPYFKTRLNHRIKAYEQKQTAGFFQQVFSDYLQPVVLTVMLCVNIYAGVLFYQTQGTVSQGEVALSQSTQAEDELLSEYSLTSYNYDNFIN